MPRLSNSQLFRSPVLARPEMEPPETPARLPNYARVLAQKDRHIAALEQRVADLEQRLAALGPAAQPCAQEIYYSKILTHTDWECFCERFERAFPGFLSKLKQRLPGLSQAERRLFLLLKLKFENHKIADTLGISLGSVWRARHRLSQKLGLSSAGRLECFVSEFGQRIGQSVL